MATDVPADLIEARNRLLFGNQPGALAGSVALVLLLAAVQSRVIELPWVIAWTVATLATVAWRARLVAKWKRRAQVDSAGAQAWLHRYRIGALAGGLAWGVGAIVLFPAGSLPHQLFLTFALCGYCAGVAAAQACDRVSAILLLTPPQLCLALGFAMQGGEVSLAMAVLTGVFYFIFLGFSKRIGEVLTANMKLLAEGEAREARLSQSEKRFRDFTECASDWLWETDAGHRFRYFSANAADALERDTSPMLGDRRSDLILREGLNPAQLATDHLAQLDSRQPFRDFEYRMRGADGGDVWVMISGVPCFGVKGEFLGYRGTGCLITERKRATAELAAARDAAEAANQAKSRFLSSVSHELRTPLNAVLGFAQLIEMDSTLPGATRAQATEIQRAGNHLLSVVNDLIDLSRIETGQLDVETRPVGVHAVLGEALAMIAPLARRHDVELREVECKCDSSRRDCCNSGGPVVRADYQRLRQVLLNLLSNAVKYNRPKGSVLPRCALNEHRVVVEILDTGPGIPVAKQPRIFSAFDRLGEEHGSIEGSGIGLVITRRLIEAMGGEIGFDSVEGAGSRFWVTLPLAPEAD